MKSSFSYSQQVKIEFGIDSSKKLTQIVSSLGLCRGVLICDKLFATNGVAKELLEQCPSLVDIYSDITPNPQLNEVVKASQLLDKVKADFVVALGGGSSMDLAKFACSYVFCLNDDIRDYFYKRKVFSNKRLTLFALPTTAGTGSEVTSVSVCNDEISGEKGPLVSNNFFPYMAIVDPMFTLSVPKFVTATTGLDALAHALESYWCNASQVISDVIAIEACKRIFNNIVKAYECGSDIKAREEMSLGSLLAGVAFSQTRTAGVHGCSYPLSINLHLCHGEACAFTLASFIRINNSEKLEFLAKQCGFDSTEMMALQVEKLQKHFNLKTRLSECGNFDIVKLATESSVHALLQNNPVKLDVSQLIKMYEKLV